MILEVFEKCFEVFEVFDLAFLLGFVKSRKKKKPELTKTESAAAWRAWLREVDDSMSRNLTVWLRIFTAQTTDSAVGQGSGRDRP